MQHSVQNNQLHTKHCELALMYVHNIKPSIILIGVINAKENSQSFSQPKNLSG